MKFLPIFPSVVGIDYIETPNINFDTIKWHQCGDKSTTPKEIINNLSEISEDKNILSSFKNLEDNVNLIVRNYIIEYLSIDQDFQIVTSWITRSFPQTESYLHKHSNCWLSGVIHLSDDGGDIRFEKSDLNEVWRSKPPFEYNEYNSTSWSIPCQKNRILIFPANLEHKILKNTSDVTRYSLAFNIIPKGYFGLGDSGFYWPTFNNK